MSLYVDTSALLKLYVDEADSDACEAFLATDNDWVTARHTLVEAGEISGDCWQGRTTWMHSRSSPTTGSSSASSNSTTFCVCGGGPHR